MTKRRNNANRQVMPKRLRAALLASVAAVGIMTAAPAPAHALFGGITKAIGGLFGGGGEGGGSGCGDGLTDSFVKAGVGFATGGPVGAGAAVVSDTAASGGGEFVGCPVIESVPGTVEIQAVKTAVESVLQTKEMVQQTVHQADMLAHSNVSIFDYLLDSWETFMALFGGGGEAESITWRETEVKGEFEEAYPENPIFETPEDLGIYRAKQDELGRAASIDSKRVSAKLAEDVEALSSQLEVLEVERQACAGQTCVADISVQIGMVTAQLQAKTALMTAAHNRVSESQIDGEREMRKAADAEWNRMIRDVDGGTGE